MLRNPSIVLLGIHFLDGMLDNVIGLTEQREEGSNKRRA
jgi:hypothetical protein